MFKTPTDALYPILVGMLNSLTYLPPRLAYGLCERLGDLLYAGLASRRRVTLENLSLALGKDKSPHELQALARAVFRNLGHHLVDFAQLRHITAARAQQMCTGWEEVANLEALAAHNNQGLLIITAHFGSWELSASLALLAKTPVNVIVRPPDHPLVHRLAEDYRQRCGYRIIAKQDQAMRESLRALSHGEAVCILMDQSSVRSESVEVEFFGIKTFTSMGPALLALRAKCAVVGAFFVREGPGRHRLVATDSIPIVRTGNLRRDVEETSQRFNAIIEAQIRRHPEQWFWLHRRWKQRS